MLRFRAMGPVAALFLLLSALVNAQQRTPIPGVKCAKNQVVNKLTVYEDGAIEAECGHIPCGVSGAECAENASSCRADSQLFSGMNWAPNGQSLLLRCCSYSVPNKVYVGTDLVTLGSFYTGGLVAKADEMVGKGGHEYDFVVNARTEQGGVRIWVYRIICPAQSRAAQSAQSVSPQQQREFDLATINEARQQAQLKSDTYEQRRQNLFKQMSENRDAQAESVAAARQPEEETVVNPLQYRPRESVRQRDAPSQAARLL